MKWPRTSTIKTVVRACINCGGVEVIRFYTTLHVRLYTIYFSCVGDPQIGYLYASKRFHARSLLPLHILSSTRKTYVLYDRDTDISCIPQGGSLCNPCCTVEYLFALEILFFEVLLSPGSLLS